MRTYTLPLNADLFDILSAADDPNNIDMTFYDYIDTVDTVHYILEIEYNVKISGAICSTVRGRGHSHKLGDFL